MNLKTRQIKSIILVFFISSTTFVNSKDVPYRNNNQRLQRTEVKHLIFQFFSNLCGNKMFLHFQRVKRQSDAVSTILQTALKFAPIIIDTFTGGGGGVGGGGGLSDIVKLVGPLLGGGLNPAAPSTATKITPVKETATTVNKVDKIGGVSFSFVNRK